MTTEQAQQVIKSVLDMAVKNGVFHNIDASTTAAQAWHVITQELSKNEKPNT